MNSIHQLALSNQQGIDIHATGLVEIEQNIRTILSTKRGTVYLDRLFGLTQRFVDDPTQTAIMAIQNDIYDAIEKYEPRVSITSITFNGNDNGELTPVVSFKIKEGVHL